MKHSRSEGGASAPAAKRQKTVTQHSLLLDLQPETLRKVCSFLFLKEALVLCQAHRRFNESSNDIYQYSFIMGHAPLTRQGFIDVVMVSKYMHKLIRGLCNLVDNENLQAVLRNETLPSCSAQLFMNDLVEHSKVDNGQAVTILLEDERCQVVTYHFETCLRRGLTTMASVLQQDDQVKKGIQMCRICSNNIGCYSCANYNECVIGKDPRYCRECVLVDNRFCKECNDYHLPILFPRWIVQ